MTADAEEPAVIAWRSVTKRFGDRIALEEVDFELRRGRVLGIVGESGSGKSTAMRMALGLERPSSGEVFFRGLPYPTRRRDLQRVRREIGFVLQDPYDSLDPRMSVGSIIAEPMLAHGVPRKTAMLRAAELLPTVGLDQEALTRYPSQYSGGGRQRIAIARALALDPPAMLCDEPTASLDVSVQAGIVNLLLRLRADRNLSLVVVSHDLALIRRIADDIVVMYAGRVMEAGPSHQVCDFPSHPYTRLLLDSVPGRAGRVGRAPADSEFRALSRVGCVFAHRCPRTASNCTARQPPLEELAPARRAACFFPESPAAAALKPTTPTES